MAGSRTRAQWWLQVVHKQEIEILALGGLLDLLKKRQEETIYSKVNFFPNDGHPNVQTNRTYIFISNFKIINTCH
jgi:hypothetical protein